jgi:hypothetical protein
MNQVAKERPGNLQFERFVEAACEPHRSHLIGIFESGFTKVVRTKTQTASTRTRGSVAAGFRSGLQSTGERPAPDAEG